MLPLNAVALSAKAIVLLAKPVALSAKAIELAAKAVVLAVKPVELAAKPVELAAKPVVLAAKPVALAAKPVALAAKPVALAAKAVRILTTRLSGPKFLKMTRFRNLRRKMNFWSRLFSDDFSDEGFAKRSQGGRPLETDFPVAVSIGNFLWEHKFLVRVYEDGVALAGKGSDEEWFIAYSKMQQSDESQRPFQVFTSRGKTKKISFGGDLLDQEILRRWLISRSQK